VERCRAILTNRVRLSLGRIGLRLWSRSSAPSSAVVPRSSVFPPRKAHSRTRSPDPRGAPVSNLRLPSGRVEMGIQRRSETAEVDSPIPGTSAKRDRSATAPHRRVSPVPTPGANRRNSRVVVLEIPGGETRPSAFVDGSPPENRSRLRPPHNRAARILLPTVSLTPVGRSCKVWFYKAQLRHPLAKVDVECDFGLGERSSRSINIC